MRLWQQLILVLKFKIWELTTGESTLPRKRRTNAPNCYLHAWTEWWKWTYEQNFDGEVKGNVARLPSAGTFVGGSYLRFSLPYKPESDMCVVSWQNSFCNENITTFVHYYIYWLNLEYIDKILAWKTANRSKSQWIQMLNGRSRKNLPKHRIYFCLVACNIWH